MPVFSSVFILIPNLVVFHPVLDLLVGHVEVTLLLVQGSPLGHFLPVLTLGIRMTLDLEVVINNSQGVDDYSESA